MKCFRSKKVGETRPKFGVGNCLQYVQIKLYSDVEFIF